MKKLALALVCLFSVAFFASCDPDITNPEPSIQALQGEEYIQDNDIVDLDTPYAFGFVVASNPQTNKDLASLVVKIGDMEWANKDLTGLKEFTYIDTVEWGLDRDIVYTDIITAVVTDADGKTATATLNVSVNQPAQQLVARTFEWYRLGNTQTGLEEFGLYWERNIKETHAQIKPIEGVTLYTFDSNVWDATTTNLDKAALFADGATEIEVYNNVSTSTADTYDDVIGTKMADGTLNLIHVTRCVIDAYQSAGYPIHITGEAK